MTTIRVQVLEAFSKCKTKAYLLAKASQIEHSAKAITDPENATPLTNELRTLLSAAEPPKFLPCTHCSECQFAEHCKNRAISADDIALLGGLKPQHIVKLRQRGIYTITQLSHTFRPRRKSKRAKQFWQKYQPSLKAMAVRDKKTYIVDQPNLNVIGTPVFFDVEGVPDQCFYYLIGMRVVHADATVHHSFWADGHAQEPLIWRDCIRTLREVEAPQLLHYGSYETTFLRRMIKRYGGMDGPTGLIGALLEKAVNAVSIIHGNVYFPTYSNGLKEIASHLGYRWSTAVASGSRSVELRRAWDVTREEALKKELIAYNRDDCQALEVVTSHLLELSAAWAKDGSPPDTVRVDSLKRQDSFNWGKTDFVFSELADINKRAYWNYQRDRIYFRNRPRRRRPVAAIRRTKAAIPINKVIAQAKPVSCFRCGSERIRWNGLHRKLLYDVKWIAGGIKRWVTQTVTTHHRCLDCGATFSSNSERRARERYGRELQCYVVYNLIQLHLSQYKLAGIIERLFGYPLSQQCIARIKDRAAAYYKGTFDQIRKNLAQGPLIHADETRIGLKGKASYVWVFTSMEEVVYIWSASREANTPQEFLRDFKGVLVSDFFSALACARAEAPGRHLDEPSGRLKFQKIAKGRATLPQRR
jgi:predicted RecB family nuclease